MGKNYLRESSTSLGRSSRPRITPKEPLAAAFSEKLIEPSGLMVLPQIKRGTGSPEWVLRIQGVEWSAVTAIITSLNFMLASNGSKKYLELAMKIRFH